MHSIAHELTIASTPEAVFDALTTGSGIERWLGGAVTGTTEVGGEIVTSGPRAVRLRIDALDRPELVHCQVLDGPEEWPGTQLAARVEPTPDGQGTVVRFWHGDWEYAHGGLARASFDWAMALAALRDELEA